MSEPIAGPPRRSGSSSILALILISGDFLFSLSIYKLSSPTGAPVGAERRDLQFYQSRNEKRALANLYLGPLFKGCVTMLMFVMPACFTASITEANAPNGTRSSARR